MFLCRKKKVQSALIYVLEEKLGFAVEKGHNYFIYPLFDHEVQEARGWAMQYHILVEPEYQKDGLIYYRFFGVERGRKYA